MAQFKSFPKDMPEWQAIQDNYNAGEQPQIFRPEEEIESTPIPANYNQQAQAEAENMDMEARGLTVPDFQGFQGPEDSEPPFISNDQPQSPLSKSEQLLQEYNRLAAKDSEDLQAARKQDRMFKIGGAVGDSLATILNAQNQMNVKAPGAGVREGAGLAKVADMFQTSPDIASDMKSRREQLLEQYKQMALGERSSARMASEERRFKDRNTAMIDAAKAKANAGLTPYQKLKEEEADEKDVRKLSSDVIKSGLPRLTQAISDLEKQLGEPLESALSKNTDDDPNNNVNIPGYGRLASIVPDKLYGTKGREFRQSVQAVLNPDISEQYGATQALGEIERYQKQIGSGTFEDQDAVLRGLTAIKRSAAADLQAIQSGYTPDTTKTYQQRDGVTLSPKQSGDKTADKDVQDYADAHFNGDYNEAFNFLKRRGDI
jgi:hypothetical protein